MFLFGSAYAGLKGIGVYHPDIRELQWLQYAADHIAFQMGLQLVLEGGRSKAVLGQHRLMRDYLDRRAGNDNPVKNIRCSGDAVCDGGYLYGELVQFLTVIPEYLDLDGFHRRGQVTEHVGDDLAEVHPDGRL